MSEETKEDKEKGEFEDEFDKAGVMFTEALVAVTKEVKNSTAIAAALSATLGRFVAVSGLNPNVTIPAVINSILLEYRLASEDDEDDEDNEGSHNHEGVTH